MNASDILSAVSAGEDKDWEFKAARRGLPGSLWETYSAMANTDGGVIELQRRREKGREKTAILVLRRGPERVPSSASPEQRGCGRHLTRGAGKNKVVNFAFTAELKLLCSGTMQDVAIIERIRLKYLALDAVLDERSRRRWAASEARDYGYGGVTAVATATGLARDTIAAGLRDLEYRESHPEEPVSTRLRRGGGGRKRLTESDPALITALESLLEPLTRGDPMSPLRWTCKSTRRLATELSGQGHQVGYRTVAWLLHEAGYSLQANRKTREGNQHPDRNAQFEFINAQAARYQKRQQPVISVDTKKKELVGEFQNGGREWCPEGQPEPVRVHDFPDKQLGKAIPYGVYDVTNNQGWVSVGIDHDTAYFAAASIGRWWQEMGASRFPRATELFITADGGGSNGYRTRLWKVALQDLADRIGLKLTVSHFPPGTSKWNKVEHRLFSFITQNWRGKPLMSVQVIVNLIAATRTKTGLVVKAALDEGKYEKGITVTDEQMAGLKLKPANFHGEWNYTIRPRLKT